MPDAPKKERRFLQGWRLLILTTIALIVFSRVDTAYKEHAPGFGYCPESASCTVAARDFGAFCARVIASDASGKVRKEVTNPLNDIQLAVRKSTGIRPTPTRWRLWLGHRLLTAQCPEGTGLCVYPGLLLRGVEVFRRVVLRIPSDDGIYRYGPYAYAWRERFLIVSESSAYVAASLKAPQPQIETPGGPDELCVQWSGSRAALLRIKAANGLPASGWIQTACSPRKDPLTLADAWPVSPMFSVTAPQWNDLVSLATACGDLLPGSPSRARAASFLRQLFARWDLGVIPENWDDGIDHCAFGLLDVVGDPLPIPRFALVMRAPRRGSRSHPLESLAGPLMTVPQEWGGRPGVFAALLGEEFALCLGQYGSDWLATSQESTMAGLAGMLKDTPAPDADVVLRINWTKVGKAAETLVEKTAALELLGRRNPDEAKAEFAPWARAVGQLGSLELQGKAVGDRIAFSGVLARPSSDTESEASR